ncbi:MAG: cytidylate kinase family protein [Patescibacteria group bacterium]
MIISLSGAPGSGKSTVAKKLADRLGYKRYYMGEILRLKAKEKNMTLAEYLKLGETDFSVDREVDQYMKELSKKEDNFIIENRTAFHILPQSLKIYLDIQEKEGAKRIFSDLKINPTRNEARNLNSVEAVIKANRERRIGDQKRYRQYYQIDLFNPKNYDFVLDTTNLNPEEEFQEVWRFVKSKLG